MAGDVVHSLPLDGVVPSCDHFWISYTNAMQGANSRRESDTSETEESLSLPNDEDSHSTKKRRLTSKQKQLLESNFAKENRLEPERKLHLAKELELQPRQVAIWFQNKRARFKNKQLEQDYVSLKRSFEKMSSEYERLLKEKESLEQEVTGNAAFHPEVKSLIIIVCRQVAFLREKMKGEMEIVAKQEEACSTKSDVFDFGQEPLHVLEEENRRRSLFLSDFYLDTSSSFCNYEFAGDDTLF